MTTRTALALLPLALALGGCWQNSYAFPTADDVRMGKSEGESMREAAPGEYGDVYALGMKSAHEVNGWVGEGVEAAGRVLRALERLPPTSHDGEYDVFGPYYDAETDRSWLIRVAGDEGESHFEVLVGAGDEEDAARMDELLDGEIAIDGDRRTGAFAMSFDAVEKHGLKSGPDRDRTYRGSMEIRFERDTESEHKLVEVTFDDFEVTQEVPIVEYFSADRYSFRRNEAGAGELVFGLVSTFQEQVWSGPERERMTLELRWNEQGAGWGEEQVLALEDGEGDLAYGDIVLQECFDEHGYVTWRELNDPYAAAFPGYASGDPASCVELDESLPQFASE
jgi:hypothetical protein